MLAEHLEQTARDLCFLFADDFELWPDCGALTRLGSGVLWIALLSSRTHHNGRDIEPLSIARKLQLWFRESLAHEKISRSEVADATLVVHFETEHYQQQRDDTVVYSQPQGGFIGFRARIRCRLVVSGVVVEVSHQVTLEWPESLAA
jgi:hypothetical protein